jgi:hypothetical protein
VRAGVGNAVVVAKRLPADVGVRVASQARLSFVHAMHTTALIAVGFILASAVAALVWLPAKASDLSQPPATAETVDRQPGVDLPAVDHPGVDLPAVRVA